MEAKKTGKANFKTKKVSFPKMGLMFALILTIAAFGCRSFEKGEEGQKIKLNNVSINKKDVPNDGNFIDGDELFVVAEVQAEFPYPGGLKGYFAEHFVYPEAARNEGIEGVVAVEFVIEKDGSVSNIKILRDIGGGCGDEMVRVLKAMPKWSPATQRGKPVRCQIGKRVCFSLGDK